jgi:class 3 adenylate cyclase
VAFIGIHLVTYLAVNAFLVAVWLLLSGSIDGLREVMADPTTADREGFWPVWPILTWGTLLVIHLLSHMWLKVVRLARRGSRILPADLDFGRSAPAPDGRAWVAVMFTDIAESTRLTEELGDAAWSEQLARHRERVRQAISRHAGMEVGTQGDGFLTRFDRPTDAVACALELQNGSLAPLHLRIGIHAGETVQDDGDLIGRVVNLASRVTAAAQPGEVLVTEPVADLVADAGASHGIGFEDRGVHQLKGIARPRHLFSARRDGEATVGSPP